MKANKPYNVLMLVMDDQRADTIHALGNPYISTPNLDELVSQGCFLSPYTTVPVCTPARAELLTGRNALNNGCTWFNEPIKPELTLLPQAFRSAGYYCCHIGKWHNNGHPSEKGYHETHRVFSSDLTGVYAGHDVVYKENEAYIEGHSTEVFTESALNFIQNGPKDQPWFCYIGMHSPHDPRTAPEPWASMYRDVKPPLPENYSPEHPFDNGDMMIRDERLEGFPRTQAKVRQHLADYYAMISHHDYCIGKIIEELKHSGQYEDTIIIFTSDHGLAIGSHGLMGKENLYEHSARVPLIVAGPGIVQGKRAENVLCGHYDFMPTLLDVVEVDIPESCQGISYAGVLRDEPAASRDHMYAAYKQCMRMARDKQYKLIEYPETNRRQLFDLVEDPLETNDLLLSWRRDPVAGVPGSVLNPPYEPLLSRADADRIAERLHHRLNEWLENK